MHRPSTPLIWIERLQRRGVEPAAAPRAAGDRAELVAALRKPRADVVGELGGEGPGADARRIGLDDAQHVVELLRADAAPAAAAPATQFHDVTYGYVPWSMSSSAPCAPSNSRLSPRFLRVAAAARHVRHHRLDAPRERERLVASVC